MKLTAMALALLCSAAPFVGAQQPSGPAQATSISRLLPDISTVGDLVGDLSPKGSTQESPCRYCVREVELSLQAVVDPYFRGDIFLGISEAEGISIEQAFLTTTALPLGLEVRLGRLLLPVGKINATHRHDLHTVEYPWVIQRFLGAEGLKSTGISVSRVFAPLGFYQEVQLTSVDGFGETDGLAALEPATKDFGGITGAARLRNYWDLSEAANLEISASAISGRRPQPFNFFGPPPAPGVNAINARQSVVGSDVTFRWRPLQQGLYRSFILQVEVLRQLNQRVSDVGYQGPTRDFSGAYGFARWQVGRRSFIGARYDWLEDPDASGSALTAGSGYLEFFPSEFSKLLAAFERTMPDGGTATNRVLLQATFALGPHKPHPF